MFILCSFGNCTSRVLVKQRKNISPNLYQPQNLIEFVTNVSPIELINNELYVECLKDTF